MKIIFEEILFCKETPHFYFSTNFINTAIPFLNRICIQNFEFFISVLNEFLIEKEISLRLFTEIWFNKMEQIILGDSRKLNVIAICKLFKIFDKENFLFFSTNIFSICLITVHTDMMRKVNNESGNIDNFSRPIIAKNLNIKMSERKKYIYLNECIGIYLHGLFLQNMKVKFFL
jgi:hypothetical protein